MKTGAKCRFCGKPILWIRMKSGAAAPCDPEPVRFRRGAGGDLMLVTRDGEVVRGKASTPGNSTGEGFTSHFATCMKTTAGAAKQPSAAQTRMEV